MKTFTVTFTDEIEAETEQEAYHKLLEYLADCAQYGDVTAFDFKVKKKS